jgi:hypothetical protein
VSDVGRAYDGRIVTCSEYLQVETSYVQALKRFLEASRLKTLRVADLQVNEIGGSSIPCELADETRAHVGIVVDGLSVCGRELDWVVRLALREALWCRLKGEGRFYIHFGYDYYVYVGSDELNPIPPPMPPGIFAEVFESPYHEEHSDDSDEENS